MQKQFGVKQFGWLAFDDKHLPEQQISGLKEYIKILYIDEVSIFEIDFQEIKIDKPSLVFVKHTQNLNGFSAKNAQVVFYNRDFYCVEIHDKEVSCDGILFNNIYEIPVITLDVQQAQIVKNILGDIQNEMQHQEWANEEMIRVLLKQLIIKATRYWKNEHHTEATVQHQEIEFIRQFSSLVERHFRSLHSVSEYAELLNITPKWLNKKINAFVNQAPNDFIKQRIILEAKKLLAHSQLSVKEIAYELGYQDPAYFVRLFRIQAGLSPNVFRKNYLSSK